jgi:hypothetical protein
MVVGSDPRDAQTTFEYFAAQIGKHIGKDLLARNCRTGSVGFTEFIIRREAEGFVA